MLVELAKRNGVARRIQKPVHVTRVLERHPSGTWKMTPDDLGARPEDIEVDVENQYRADDLRRHPQRRDDNQMRAQSLDIGASLWWNRHMLETPEEMDSLQHLLDTSAAGAGPHLRSIITDDRRLSATQVCQRLQGMFLLALATVTADGRPLIGPVDGYLIHGSFFFSSGRDSVRMRHLSARPPVSASYLPGEELAVTVHGRAELFDVSDPARGELRQAMLDFYLPKQGPAFESWLDRENPIGARIAAEKMFTFRLDS